MLFPPSTESLPVEHLASCYEKEPTTTIVIRTVLSCTSIYIGIGIWFGVILRHTGFVGDVDKVCLHHISQYCVSISPSNEDDADRISAPVVNEVRPNWHTIRYNGTFFHENIYRQAASPEVDAAWEALGIECKIILFQHM